MTSLAPLDRLAAFQAATLSLPPAMAGTPVALGWATVELDRAVVELCQALGIPADRFAAAADSFHLGARCLVAHAALPGDRSLIVLEPSIEGRLAATLARHDEGPVAVWLAIPDVIMVAAPAPGAPGARVTTSSERTGPLGFERLVLGGPIHGPHRLLVRPPGTIASHRSNA